MQGSQPIRFLIILSMDDGGDVSTSTVTLARIAPAYYMFKDDDAEVVLATKSGGNPSLPDFRDGEPQHTGVRRFLLDRVARDDLADTLSAAQIVPDDFDAALCLGFTGTLWGDESEDVSAILASLLVDGKPVAVIPGNTVAEPPHAARAGLLIFGETDDSTVLAAHALLAIVKHRRNCSF